MAVFKVKLRDLEKTPVNLPTDEPNLIIVTRDTAYRLEVADVHFNFDSAVFLPDAGPDTNAEQTGDPSITGLAVLKACLRYAQAHPEQPIVIAGHTDTVGTPGYNLTLSSLRAQNVQAALLGKRDDWVSSAAAKHCVADYQRILTFTADRRGWDCDPGGVDNKGGPKTAQAVKNFQASYNNDFQASIDVDGGVGPQTWGAFFDVYMRELRDLLGTDDAGLAALQQGITFVDPANAAVGCGENHPIEAAGRDDYRSSTNRRVEILFFTPGDGPSFPCHPSPSSCVPAVCPIYRSKHYTFDPLPIDPTLYRVFRFGLLIDRDPWIGDATVQLLESDGSVAQAVRVGDGTPSGSYRLFDFRIKEGAQYSAVLVGDGGTLTLFDATTLSVVASESDNDGLQHVTTPSWQDETA
jgi:outer membrane protein OmpA-like peptidoglycan-associated protein